MLLRARSKYFFAFALGHTLLFRGLRVRIGMHSGIDSSLDVFKNPSSGRTRYVGRSMAVAKAVCDAAQGGMVLLSQDAFQNVSG